MRKSGIKNGSVDVTAGLERRNTILNNEVLHDEVLRQLAEAVLILDRELHITYINAAFQRVLGYAPEDVIGKPLSILTVPGEPDPLQPAEIVRRVNEAGWWHGKVLRRAKDGSAIPFILSASVIRDKQEGITGYVGTYLDLRETQRVEQRFQSLIEHSSDIITLFDRTGTVSYITPSVRHVLGRTPEDLMGRDPFVLVHPDDLSNARQVLTEALQNPGKIYRAEFRLLHVDGHYVDVETAGRSLLDDPSVAGVIFNTRDITDRKRAEAALRESEEKFRGLVETTTDWIWRINEHGVYTYASPQVHNILGYESKEILGKTPFDLMPPSEARRIRQVHESIVASQKPFHLLENINLHKNGRVVVLETSGAPVFDQAGVYKGFHGIDRDITARKHVEDTLRHANRALKTLSACNNMLVHATDETRLFNDMCHMIVETGGYTRAWVGHAERDEAKHIRPVAQTGFEPEFFQNFALSWADDGAGSNSIGAVVREGGTVVVRDVFDDPVLARLGGGAACVFPLTYDDETFGVLGIYSNERDAFGRDELMLLTELVEDLNFGVLTLRTRTERDRAVAEHERSLEQLRESLEATVAAIAATVEMRDPYTAGHERRVAEIATAIARELGLPRDRIDGIHFGALIHDLGKIKIPSELLSKPTALTKAEFELVKEHAQAGYDILKGIQFPWPVAEMAIQHHERVDGTGYPNGLRGDEMLVESRILAVADVVEAMASHRPYRPALGLEAALEEINSHRGTWYDPAAVDACMRLFKEKGFTLDNT